MEKEGMILINWFYNYSMNIYAILLKHAKNTL